METIADALSGAKDTPGTSPPAFVEMRLNRGDLRSKASSVTLEVALTGV